MILNRRARSATLIVSSVLLGAIYVGAWLTPAVTADHESAANLVLAKEHALTGGLFPILLSLFTLVSSQTQWLKLLPLACTAGWLVLLRRLLLRMGASDDSSLLLVGLTAVSPMVVMLSSNLVGESLFGLLVTGTLLKLLDDRPVIAGAMAGLATITFPVGAPLIVACILTLAVRSRFRSAMIFAAVAMVISAPWLGWALAQSAGVHSGLGLNERSIVASRNLIAVFRTPVELMTGLPQGINAASSIFFVVVVCLVVRRQLVPDLFVALYALTLMFPVWPPERKAAAILPLVLWIVWRAVREVKYREVLAAVVLIVAGLAVWADGSRLAIAAKSGVFPEGTEASVDWGQMRALFAAVTAKTSQGSVVLANMDGAFAPNTNRKTVRGFTEDGYNLFYAQKQSTVTPDQLSGAIIRDQVNYVVVTPDRGEPESASFHKSVEALERGGVLRPVELTGVGPEYRLLHVESAGY